MHTDKDFDVVIVDVVYILLPLWYVTARYSSKLIAANEQVLYCSGFVEKFSIWINKINS